MIFKVWVNGAAKTKCSRPRVNRREKERIVRIKVNAQTEGFKDTKRD